MKYKVGDKVKLKSKEELDRLKQQHENLFIPNRAYEYAGSVCTICEIWEGGYRFEGLPYFWVEDMIEGLLETAADAWKKVDEKMDARYQKEKTYYDGEQWSTEFECPEGYIFKDENGNVINATKIVLEKKKKEYPKTYEECCKVMGIDSTIHHTIGTHFRYRDTIEHFIKLLICRDAYWKIAGEEMGLSKPWEPYWNNDNQFKYVITCCRDNVNKDTYTARNTILAFPTAEMRDAFYENFKEDIEFCKELL